MSLRILTVASVFLAGLIRPSFANCENYEDGSSSASAPKAILCYKGKCENTTVSYECGNVTQGNSLAYANGLVIDNGVFENKYRKMNPLDWICIQITEDGCDANFWGPKSRFVLQNSN